MADQPAKRDRRSTRKGAVLLFLFALPFAGIGVFTLWLAVSSVGHWLDARTWAPVPARILEADLERHTDGDGTTYRVTARYEYEWNGTVHTGTRVGLSSGADNIGSFHQDAYRELAAHRDRDEPLTAWVDPEDPSRSVLYRRLRWELVLFESLFGAAFGVVGFGLMALTVVGSRRLGDRDRLRDRYPDEPWRWKQEWDNRTIPSHARAGFLRMAAFALLWNLISAPVLIFVPDELAGGNRLAAIALIFPLIGAWLAWTAIRKLVQWRRFGATTLELQTFPATPGGTLEGTIETALPFGSELAGRLRLSCTRTETTGSGSNRSTTKRILWQDERRVDRSDVHSGRRGAAITVRYPIPEDVEPTSPEDATPEIEWQLELTIPRPGVDFETSFEVPVFAVPGHGDTAEEHPPEESAELAPRGGWDADLADRGIRVHQLPAGGVRVDLGRSRHPAVAAGVGGFTAVWTAIVFGLAYSDAPIIFPVVFGVCLVLLLVGLWGLILVRRSIDASREGLRFAHGSFGHGRERRLPAAKVRELRTAQGMQAGTHLYWRIVAVDASGTEHLLATQIGDRGTARHLVRVLEDALGRSGDDGRGSADGGSSSSPW